MTDQEKPRSVARLGGRPAAAFRGAGAPPGHGARGHRRRRLHRRHPRRLSRVNYYVGGLFSEVLFRLLPLGFGVWLVSTKLLGGRGAQVTFWVGALAVGLVEPAASWQILTGPDAPAGFGRPVVAALFLSVAYVLNVLAAYLFWRRGLLAAVVLRWSFCLVWHVAWPLVHYG